MQNNALSGVNFTELTNGVVTASGGNTTIAVTSFHAMFDGVVHLIATRSGATISTDGKTKQAFVALDTNQEAFFTLQVNKDNDWQVTQGSIVNIDGPRTPLYGVVLKDYLPTHLMWMQYTGSSTFTFGANNWNSDGVIRNYYRIPGILPARSPKASASSVSGSGLRGKFGITDS